MSELSVFGTRKTGCEYVPRAASYAVICDADGFVAFVQGESHIWLVGGGAEPGESPEETIRREALEEAGSELIIDRVIGVARQYFDVDGAHYDMHATFFAATFSDAVSDPEEGVVWLDPTKVSTEIFHDSLRWAIECCLGAGATAQ